MKTPGDQLRAKRLKLGLTTRDVDSNTRKLAIEKENEDYVVSHARLVQIENGESTPSVYKLYALSVVYGCSIIEIISLYVDASDVIRQHISLDHSATHLIDVHPSLMQPKLTFPVRFDPAANIQKTSLVSRMVELWGEVPVGLLQGMDLRRGRWGYIGSSDYTMFPLLRPGSLVQIDSTTKPVIPSSHRSEYDRPIYFLELRDGYVCSWCEFHKGRIVAVPHPLSGAHTREFAYPSEVSVIGRVVAIAARLVSAPALSKTQDTAQSLRPAQTGSEPTSESITTREES